MRRLRYLLLDVFTHETFGGNPLAVFLNGRGISTETMQRIAKELNLSETTFVLPPEDPANHYRVRIFTPTRELPMAGHPTVGTAYALALEQMVDLRGERIELRLEEGVGLIPVTVDLRDGQPINATMTQPLPQYGMIFEDRPLIAEMVSLNVADFDDHYPAQVISCGVPILIAPVKTLDAMQRMQLRLDVSQRVLRDDVSPQLFAFTRETVLPTSTVHSRMFAPPLGILEDPATGGACGPLGSYMVKYGMASGTASGAPARIISEQGFEMGRRSLINIEIDHAGEQIKGVRVGGQSVLIGEGALFV